VLGDLCARGRLASNLVASNNDIRALVRARLAGDPVPADLSLAQGWRAGHILPDLVAVLEGRRMVRVANLKAEAPLGYQDVPSPCEDDATTEE
jgi:ribonuclease D